VLAFGIYQAEYVRRTKAFIKAWTDFEPDSQGESDDGEPSFDEDGEDVPDPVRIPIVVSPSSTCGTTARGTCGVFSWNSRVRKYTRKRRYSAPAARIFFCGG
jgi:hypothetical protein